MSETMTTSCAHHDSSPCASRALSRATSLASSPPASRAALRAVWIPSRSPSPPSSPPCEVVDALSELGASAVHYTPLRSPTLSYSLIGSQIMSETVPAVESPANSDRFWFEDGSVIIQVDNTLYNVYRGVLMRQSSFFRLKLEAVSFTKPLVSQEWGVPKGRIPSITGCGSLQCPLSLDVCKSEFETLLSYMHPMDYQSLDKFTAQEWIAIANVSTQLRLMSIRAAAIDNVLKFTGALDLIEIGRKRTIPECYVEGFRLLCFREKSLSLEEGQSLGLASVIMIARARDMLAKDSKWSEIEPEFIFQFEVGV